MKHLAILTVILTVFIALVIPITNGQTPPSSSPAVASPSPAAEASASPEVSVAPAAKQNAASSSDIDGFKAKKEARNNSGIMGDILGTLIFGLVGLISQLVPFIGAIIPIAIIWLIVSARRERRKLTHETIRLMIEKGQPIPPELFRDFNVNPYRPLYRAVVFIAVGIGIVVFYGATHTSTWALIPLLMGIGYIVVWKIQGSEKNNNKNLS